MTPDIIVVQISKPIGRTVFQYLLQFSPPEKQKRILRQRIKQSADAMVVGGALARYMLWKAFHIPPDARITYGEFGKPYLPNYPKAHFNISHSRSYVACVVYDRPIGIDIQVVGPYRSAVARRVCTPEEVKQIEASTDPTTEFTGLWTQKEAYLKMSGRGLSGDIKALVIPETQALNTFKYENTFFSYASA